MAVPDKLNETLEALEMVPDRNERIQLLIDIAGRFEEVPPRLARRPFAAEHQVPACESEAYVFGEERPDGTLDFHFAVENPQGISAKAMAVILGEALSGAPPAQVAEVSQDVVYQVFGRELSMGKSMGLMSMVGMVAAMAKRHGERKPA
ncbi:MAG: cysteine desulfuration protein SufE [Solirubrobacteraceae bacterium]|jgi:cysteine desulfuration protein SufE|nr:cysteine desulfuration protein SufE [Solirubrobacteraceae bacterium]